MKIELRQIVMVLISVIIVSILGIVGYNYLTEVSSGITETNNIIFILRLLIFLFMIIYCARTLL